MTHPDQQPRAADPRRPAPLDQANDADARTSGIHAGEHQHGPAATPGGSRVLTPPGGDSPVARSGVGIAGEVLGSEGQLMPIEPAAPDDRSLRVHPSEDATGGEALAGDRSENTTVG
ncbi:MAG TPA: hypothetical protein VEL07_15845 [Planctomycetota bacterium]|nr:hypothetical protein [Planctomycetota bacterium]